MDAHDVFEGKLEAPLLAMQERMTRRAYNAFGQDVAHQTVLRQDEFLLHGTDMGLEQTRRLRGGDVPPLADPEEKAARVLQGCLRRCLIAPLNPWYHIMRLVALEHMAPVSKSGKTKSKEKSRGKSTTLTSSRVPPRPMHSANPPPPLPWCRCWMSLEPTHELDSKGFDLMQQVVFDFEDNQLETCLRRIDNIVLWRKRVQKERGMRKTMGRAETDEVLVELAALCNRFGLKLYFMGKLESSNAFYSRALQLSHMTSGVDTGHNPEIYAWTCDLIAFCLWHQGKFEAAHHALSRSVHATVPTNMRLVSRLHAALLLLHTDKVDLSLKISSPLLVELLQQRHAHTLEVHGTGMVSPAAEPSPWESEEMLRIIEFRHEQTSQPSAPAYVNLLCHAALTVAYGLAYKCRYKDAMTVAQVLVGHLRGGSPGVSRDLKDSVPLFVRWLDQIQTNALQAKAPGMMQTPHAAFQSSGSTLPSLFINQAGRSGTGGSRNKGPFRTGKGGGATSAEPSMMTRGVDSSFAGSLGSIDGRIFSGGVVRHPPGHTPKP